MQRRLINPAGTILIEGGFITSRYERMLRPIVWTETGIKRIEVVGYDFTNGGGRRPLTGSSISLWIDGARYQTVARKDVSVFFDVDVGKLAEGWHWIDVTGDVTETTIPICAYVRKGARGVAQALMPIVTHSHDMLFPTVGRNEELLWGVPAGERTTIHFGMVPARFAPTTNPLVPRDCPPISTELSADNFACTQIAPCRLSDIHRASVTSDGVMTTSGTQCYFYSDFVAKMPAWALLDGPRGQGTVTAPTHLQVGRDGKIYGTDPWRLFRVGVDGSVQTLVGWRHKTPPSHYLSPPQLELVGDWSAIPAARQGMHEVWGMAWDERTLAVDEAAAPISTENNEKPHITGPVAFVADTQNNRILRVEFSAAVRSAPAKVTEFIVGLRDPWDIVYRNGELIISERMAHRIVVYSASTGAFSRVLLQGADLAYVDNNRKPRYRDGQTLATARAQSCVLPEGLAVMDDFLYFGSRTMEQIRRINLRTGGIESTQDIYCDGNSMFAKIAVSDGSFLPKGTMFVVTWSNRKYGFPHAYLPDGREHALLPSNPSKGTLWGDGGYSTTVGIGQGRLVCGYVQEGLTMLSRLLPTDGVKPANAGAGALDYWRRGFRSLHGVNGWGHYGLPLPWGVNADIDAYLTYCGHRR